MTITNINSDVDFKLFSILTKYFDAKREFLDEFKLNLVYNLEDMTQYHWKCDSDIIIIICTDAAHGLDFMYEYIRNSTVLTTENYSIFLVRDLYHDVYYTLFDNRKFIS